jgi:methionyl aminopeptidase
MIRPGITTAAINKAVHDYIREHGATPSFLGYAGFPASVCISINSEVIHGIPGKRILREGDIVSVDVGACYKGYHGDCAGTYAAGVAGAEAERLIKVTRQSFFEMLPYVRKGYRISDIGNAIQAFCESNGFSVVRQYVGHGIGKNLHEEPEVPNFGNPNRGARLQPGMTLAIEPMVNAGGAEVRVLKDMWTVVTADGSLSAHYENTVLITDGEPELLTMAEGD